MRRATDRALAAALALAFSLVASLPATATATAQRGAAPRAGVEIVPDTVRVGDPFTVVIAVLAPRGATIEFPPDPDSGAVTEAVEARRIAEGPRSDSTMVEQQATYRLTAWDIEAQPVLPGEVLIRWTGGESRIALAGYTVYVQSVLPADSALRVAKPPRDLVVDRAIPWWAWAALLAAAILSWWLWYWWRHRRPAGARVIVDPYEHAIAELDRIEALGLVDAGERGRHVALVVDVLRGYLAARLPSAPRSHTSSELLTATHGTPTVLHDRLLRLLNEADLIKFARRPVSRDRARDLAVDVRALIEHEHVASQPPAEGARGAASRKDAERAA